MSQSSNNLCKIEDNNKNNNQFIIKKLKAEENPRSYSFSTTETIENDYQSETEIDFNQDFFPKKTKIKFTDFLVDNWELAIKNYISRKYQLILNNKKI